MLRQAWGDLGGAWLGWVCPLPAALQAGLQEAGQGPRHTELLQLAERRERSELRTTPQGWLGPFMV